MQDLRQVLSPISWLIVILGFHPLFLIPFEPTLKEYLVLMVVDSTALFFAMKIELAAFLRKYPPPVENIFDFDGEKLSRLPLDQRRKFYEYYTTFPSRRAAFTLPASFVKALPGFAVIVFYWHHDQSYFAQFVQVLLAASVPWFYVFGASFIEAHAFVSRKFAEMHERYDWTEVFAGVRLPDHRRDFRQHENISMIAIAGFVIAVQSIVVAGHGLDGVEWLTLKITIIGLSGICLMSRIWYLNRSFFLGGLESIFAKLAAFDPHQPQRALALHTAPLLAHFELTFNTLLSKLREYEQELSHWIYSEAEKNRFKAIGEVSGLVVHDISAPLHVMNFCAEKLKTDPAPEDRAKYIHRMHESLGMATELVESLRSWLKNPNRGSASAVYFEAHTHVLRLLELRYYETPGTQINYIIDPQVQNLNIALPKPDLIHVLFNLFSNSIENLLSNKTPQPTLEVVLHAQDAGRATLHVRDNGSGLDADRFEELTGFQTSQKSPTRDGLGLRLIRRLVEQYGGTLKVEPALSQGTLFRLELPLKAS
ncbi:GHKL domain-containing protein [bacterium]|nr:GHKL domain-containing protein [bacterium]